MQYDVTAKDKVLAKNPHHIFNLNIIITHLALTQVSLEIGQGATLPFLLIPVISGLVVAYLYFHGQSLVGKRSWFVVAHWVQAWRRGRNLLISYAIAITVMAIAALLGELFGGNLMMNDFSDDGSSTSIIQKIGMFFGGLVVLLTVIYNFMQTGISIYEAGTGKIDPKIERFLPRNENANAVLASSDDLAKQTVQQ